MNIATGATTQPSIFGEITGGELVLLVAGGALTLLLIGFFIWVIVRTSRDSGAADGQGKGDQSGK